MSIELSLAKLNVNPTANQSAQGAGNEPQPAKGAAEQPEEVTRPMTTPQGNEAQKGGQQSSQQESRPSLETEQLEIMAQKLQHFIGSLNKGLEFSVHEDSGRDVIKVIDRESGDVVRQLPSEEVLDLVSSLSDTAGNFVNVKT